jgi:signal peptidase II
VLLLGFYDFVMNGMNQKFPIILNEKATYRYLVFWLIGSVLLVGIDQLSKGLVFRYTEILSFEKSFGLTQFKNDQFAFSLPIPLPITYTIYFMVFVGIIWYFRKRYSAMRRMEWLGWALVISGGVSNVFERLFIGYVRDIIQIPFGGIINLADIYISFGIVLLLISELRVTRQG